MADRSNDNICSKCIGDSHFSNWIRKNGVRGKCDFDESHGGRNKVVTISEFAEYVDTYFQAHFHIGEEYATFAGESDHVEYRRHGSPLDEVLSDLLQPDSSSTVDAIIDALPDDGAYDGDPFYDVFQNYESHENSNRRQEMEAEEYYEFLYERQISSSWNSFCETVKHSRRFFNNKKILDNLFGSRRLYESGKINPIYELNPGEQIFRARLVEGSLTRKKFQRDPAKELSSPPKEMAVAGRMNVGFIPVFYGAFDKETALYEVRPSIGQSVVVGKFLLKKSLRVFDFTVFDDAVENKDQDRQHTRYHFIRHIHDYLAKPVSPFEKDLEYIPTQVVAEYLKSVFKCDAIIYKSSLFGNVNNGNGRNIVLLSKQTKRSSTLHFQSHQFMKTSNISYRFQEHN